MLILYIWLFVVYERKGPDFFIPQKIFSICTNLVPATLHPVGFLLRKTSAPLLHLSDLVAASQRGSR